MSCHSLKPYASTDKILLAAQTREGVLNWITNNKYQAPHNLALQGLLEDTGKWFFDRSEYKEWRSTSASSMLWLHGIRKYTNPSTTFSLTMAEMEKIYIAGAGKTKLTYVVTTEILQDMSMLKHALYQVPSNQDTSFHKSE